MPITISRTGELLGGRPITQEERDMLWRALFRRYIRSHPEVLKEFKEDETQ